MRRNTTRSSHPYAPMFNFALKSYFLLLFCKPKLLLLLLGLLDRLSSAAGSVVVKHRMRRIRVKGAFSHVANRSIIIASIIQRPRPLQSHSCCVGASRRRRRRRRRLLQHGHREGVQCSRTLLLLLTCQFGRAGAGNGRCLPIE